ADRRRPVPRAGGHRLRRAAGAGAGGGRPRPHARRARRGPPADRRLPGRPVPQPQLRQRLQGQQLGDAAAGHPAGPQARLGLARALSRRPWGVAPHPGARPTAPSHMSELLSLEDVTLSFRGLNALSEVSFALPEGQVAALIGPNGAGKTSLFNVVCGFYRPQRGTVRWRGQDITGTPPHRVARAGIGRSFQNIELFKTLTCLDNLLLGRHLHVRSNLFGAMFATRAWV